MQHTLAYQTGNRFQTTSLAKPAMHSGRATELVVLGLSVSRSGPLLARGKQHQEKPRTQGTRASLSRFLEPHAEDERGSESGPPARRAAVIGSAGERRMRRTTKTITESLQPETPRQAHKVFIAPWRATGIGSKRPRNARTNVYSTRPTPRRKKKKKKSHSAPTFRSDVLLRSMRLSLIIPAREKVVHQPLECQNFRQAPALSHFFFGSL